MNLYKDEIIYVYVVIENWFSKGMGSLEVLIVCFVVDFMMIMSGGVCLDYLVFGVFFQVQCVCCLGLVIVVEYIDFVVEWLEGVVLCYCE